MDIFRVNFNCFCGKKYSYTRLVPEGRGFLKPTLSRCDRCGELIYSSSTVKVESKKPKKDPLMKKIRESKKKAKEIALEKLSTIEEFAGQKVSKEYREGFIQAIVELTWDGDKNK